MAAPTTGLTSTQLAGLGVATSIASAYSSIVSGQIQEINYEMKAAQVKAQAAAAVSMAKINNLKLQNNYNKVASNQALAFSTQGRSFSSGSIQNILRQDANNLAWDQEFMKLTGDMNASSLLADAEGYKGAGTLARQGGVQKGLLTIAQGAVDYAKVK